MSSKFLDKTGLDTLWAKIKSTFQTVGNLVTAWGSTPSDTKYPSEKLVKDSLDGKVSARAEQVATVQDLIQSVRVKPGGSVGSAYLTSSSTVSGFSIPSAWYNYIWVPHRDGSASSDNQKYGTLILTLLTYTPDVYVIEGAELAGSSPTYRAIKLANNTDARTISQDVSKGANLVVNGSGRMSSGYNFSGFLYIPTIANGGSAGSFGFSATTAEDEYISCDFNKKIVFSADIKNLVAQPSNCVHRIYVAEYDIDKKIISAINVMFGVGTLTELTQDLNPGDTVVHFADLSGAKWIATEAYQRGFIFWNYTNSYGYLYPPETYSRNVYIGASSAALYENANVNVSAGTITLNSGWTGPKIPSGTKVSRRQSGGTYPYPANVTASDTNWHTLKGSLKGIAEPGTSERGAKFSQGTAFIRVGVYPTNLSNADEVTGKRAVVANLAVYEEQDINDGFGTLPVNRGGTGKTSVTAGNYLVGNGTSALTEKTPKQVGNNVLPALDAGSDNVLDTDYIIASNHTSGATDATTFVRRKAGKLWNYIKGQISSVLGLSESNGVKTFTGNAATATTAAGYTSGGAIDTALQGKVDKETGKGLSTNDFTDTYKSNVDSNTSARHTHSNKSVLDGISSTDVDNWNAAEPNVQSDWNQTTTTADDYIKNKPTLGTAAAKDVPASGNASTTQVVIGSDSRLTRSVWSGGSNAVCGYKICSTSQIAGKSGQTSNIYAIVMGSMCLTNKYAAQPQGSDSSGVDGALAMGSFMIWCEGKPDGTITARARLFSSDAALNNADLALCKKYVNGAVEWFVAFGPWNSSKAVTVSRSFGMSVCFDYVQNVNIPDTLEAVPSGYGYEDYYSLWKHPYLHSTQQGAGSKTIPVYVTANGEVKECNKPVQVVNSIDTSSMISDVLYVM